MRPSTRKYVLALLALFFLGAASSMLAPLNAQRKHHHLVLPPMADAPPVASLYTPLLALGRAPLVAVLWIQATKHKEEGHYFDAYQLSKRICELQPKFASVWAFQAWNMSYNISVTLKTPEERWRWVRNGYELLRDKGIPLNPNNAQLYKELAWILFHKVGDFMDDWHWYYKLQFAIDMEKILGTPPDDYVAPGTVRGDFYRNYDYKSLAEAPSTYEDVLNVPGVRELAEGLDGFGIDVSEPGIYIGLLSSIREGKVEMPDTPSHLQEDRMQELLSYMSEPEGAEARTALERYWRALGLRTEVRLDPQRIVELQEAFGVSLDFRLAETQALYWANVGMEMGTDKREAMDIHKLNTNRIEFYCIQKMFHRGRLAMSRNAHLGEPPLLSPDIRMVPVLFQAFINDSEEYLKNEKQRSPVSTNFQTGFVGFTRSAILRLHELGMNKDAKFYFDYLREHYPDSMYKDGLDGFLRKQVLEVDRELNDYRVATARIQSLIIRGIGYYAYDEDEDAIRYLARAKDIYNKYQKGIVSQGRQSIQFTFDEIIVNLVHERGRGMYRATYERVCNKMGIKPLLPRTQGGDEGGRDGGH